MCVSEGKEPSPKWHVCNYHWLDFFVQNGFTWDGSEEAIEGSHGLIDRYAQQSARFVGHEKKLFGTMNGFQGHCSTEFQQIKSEIHKPFKHVNTIKIPNVPNAELVDPEIALCA